MEIFKTFYKSKYFDVFFWVFITLIVLFVRLWNLDGLSLRLDEAQSVWQASHTTDFIKDYMLKNVHLPLHNTLLHFWMRLFGSSEFSVRFMALIPGVLSVFALYFLSKEIIGKKSSRLAALIGALSPMWVWYSREIRMCTLLTLVCILSYLYFVRVLKYGKFRNYFLYFVVNVIGIYTHYFFSLVLVVQALFYLVGVKSKSFRFNSVTQRSYFKKLVFLALSALAVLTAFSPWLYALVVNYGSGSLAPVLAKPMPYNVILSYFEFTNGFLPDEIAAILISFWPVVILFSFMFLTKRQNPFSAGVYLAILGAIVPMIVVYSASIFIKPMFLVRYLISITPMYYILLAWYINELKGKARGTFFIVFVFMLLASLYLQMFHPNNPVRESYREATRYVMEAATPRDLILVSPPYTIYPFNYYYKGDSAVTTLPVWNKKKGAIPATTEEILQNDLSYLRANRQKFYLLLTSNLEGSDLVKEYFDNHYTKLDKKQFSKDIWVEVYQAEYR